MASAKPIILPGMYPSTEHFSIVDVELVAKTEDGQDIWGLVAEMDMPSEMDVPPLDGTDHPLLNEMEMFKVMIEPEAKRRKMAGYTVRLKPNPDHKVYYGNRIHDGPNKVWYVLNDIHHDLPHHVKHSPDGFGWGYGGLGPSELARCLVIDMTGNMDPEPYIYQAVKNKFIAPIKSDKWSIDSRILRQYINEVENRRN